MRVIYETELLKDGRIKMRIDNQTFTFTLDNMPEQHDPEFEHFPKFVINQLNIALDKLHKEVYPT